jgi:hypothetical protein
VSARLPTKKRVVKKSAADRVRAGTAAPARQSKNKAQVKRKRPAADARTPSSFAHTPAIVEMVTRVLEGYLERGVFRSFNPGPSAGGKASFKMLWHHDRRFELLLDVPAKSLEFPLLLPGVPDDSPMYNAYETFVDSLASEELVPHRRIEPAKARLSCANRNGNIALTMRVRDRDFEYATRKLIHAVHETFLGFLSDGPYYDYLVEQFDLDPDRY